jgi:transposase
MDTLHERCADLDISKKDVKACVRVPGTKRRGSFTTETMTWGSKTNAVLALRDHLLAAEVTLVVIAATSDYWKPFYYLLTEDLDVILVNARQVKNLPGRKASRTRPGWPNSARTVRCDPPPCRHSQCVNCGI